MKTRQKARAINRAFGGGGGGGGGARAARRRTRRRGGGAAAAGAGAASSPDGIASSGDFVRRETVGLQGGPCARRRRRLLRWQRRALGIRD
jgi:hypothetical protein